MKVSSSAPRLRAGFTLIELLVVVTIITLLFVMVVGGYSYAQYFAKSSATKATMGAMASGLENYKNEFGEYPEPANPGATVSIAQKSYIVAGAAMLYQALSGDGYDNIKLKTAPAGKADSDGQLDDNEVGYVMLKDMPNKIWTNQGGYYYMVDGFGKPFQYTKAVGIDPTKAAGGDNQPITNNQSSYDLWSYGSDEENITAKSIDATTNGTLKSASQKWITNW